MKIYQMKMAPNPRRVRMFLAEKGVIDRFEFVELDLQRGDNLSAEFKAKNPMRKVPVLELDDGTCIAETTAICRFVDETFPDQPLMGRTPLERAQIEQWTRWVDFYFFMPTGMAFQHCSGYFKDRMTVFPEWGDECKRHAQGFFGFLDQQLAGKTWLVGDALSIADINAFCTIDFNKVNRIGILPEQENLQAWYDRLNARPSAKA